MQKVPHQSGPIREENSFSVIKPVIIITAPETPIKAEHLRSSQDRLDRESVSEPGNVTTSIASSRNECLVSCVAEELTGAHFFFSSIILESETLFNGLLAAARSRPNILAFTRFPSEISVPKEARGVLSVLFGWAEGANGPREQELNVDRDLWPVILTFLGGTRGMITDGFKSFTKVIIDDSGREL